MVDVCVEDRQFPAVACCFCGFPISTLCAEHLKQHDVENYTRFEHFHLPLYAAQLITTLESKLEYSRWLYKLHSAYSLLRKQQQDIASFELSLDSLAGEMPGLAELLEVKGKVQALKAAFCAEVETAIQATRSHCIDSQWTPGSLLSKMIWDFDPSRPDTLEVVRVKVQKATIALHLAVHSSHPTLSQYNLELSHSVLEERQRAALQQRVSELQEANASLAAANERYGNEIQTRSAKHSQEIADLQAKHDKATKEITTKFAREKEKLEQEKSELIRKHQEREREKKAMQENIEKLQSELHLIRAKVEQGTKEWNLQVAEMNARKQELEKEISRQRTEMAAKAQQHAAEMEKLRGNVKSQYDKEKADLEAKYLDSSKSRVRLIYLSNSQRLKEQGKYEECCAELEEVWEAVQSKPVKDKRAIAIGAALTEALAIHQGRFGDAEAVANHTLQIATENNILSKEVYELKNCKAALYCHSGKFAECISTCKAAFLSNTKHDAELLWTTLYYLAVASFQMNILSREETPKFAEFSRQTADSSLSQVLMHFVSSRLLFHRREFQQAADQLSEAERIAVPKFSTSIYFAMIYYFQGRVYRAMGRLAEARMKYAEAEKQFSSHSPASVFRVYCLTWISDACKDLKKELDLAIKHRRKVEEILSTHHPDLLDRPLNLCKLAELLQASGQKEKAVESYAEADLLFKRRFRGEACYRLNLTHLAELYEDLKLYEKATEKRVEADREYREQDPTNLAYPVNLTRLADLHFNSGQWPKALEIRLEADAIFKRHHLADINTAMNLSSLGIYSSMMGRTEAEKYFSEAKDSFTANHPLTNDAALNLYHFAVLKASRSRTEAVTLLQAAIDIWVNNDSDDAQRLALPMLRELRDQK